MKRESDDNLEGAPPKKALKVDDALAYLDEVKRSFQDKPGVYTSFLEIMKDFKSGMLDTPGVITRVTTLFDGHPTLVEGFNAFLPPGYRISDQSSTQKRRGPAANARGSENRGGGRNSKSTPSTSLPALSYSSVGVPPPSGHANAGPASTSLAASSLPTMPSTSTSSSSAGPSSALHVGNKQTHPPIDFDEAVNYVTKIKNRFEHEPHVYRDFLSILHSYQDKLVSITDVYNQVHTLFADHEDLLSEFSKFMPAGSEEYAEEHPRPRPRPSRKEKRKQTSRKDTPSVPDATAGSIAESLRDSQAHQPDSVHPLIQFLRESKHRLHETGRGKSSYGSLVRLLEEFVAKSIELEEFGAHSLPLQIALTEELQNRVEEIIADFPSAVQLFSTIIEKPYCFVDIEEGLKLRRPELFPASKSRFGPSYHTRPLGSERLPRSSRFMRLGLFDQVLNDRIVSMPAGSEEGTNTIFKRSPYDEILFQCEDDRCELDVIIEQNLSTIRFFAPLVDANGDPQHATETLSKKMRQLKDINKASIIRLYGENAPEVFDALKRGSASTIHLVLRRLRQKDEEWRKVRIEFNKHWKDVYTRNYTKSLESQAIAIRQAEKRLMQPHVIISELESSNSSSLATSTVSIGGSNGTAPSSSLNTTTANLGSTSNGVLNPSISTIASSSAVEQEDRFGLGLSARHLVPTLKYTMQDLTIHPCIFDLFVVALELETNHPTSLTTDSAKACLRSGDEDSISSATKNNITSSSSGMDIDLPAVEQTQPSSIPRAADSESENEDDEIIQPVDIAMVVKFFRNFVSRFFEVDSSSFSTDSSAFSAVSTVSSPSSLGVSTGPDSCKRQEHPELLMSPSPLVSLSSSDFFSDSWLANPDTPPDMLSFPLVREQTLPSSRQAAYVLFYGDVQLYVFFRHYQVVFERLSKIRQVCRLTYNNEEISQAFDHVFSELKHSIRKRLSLIRESNGGHISNSDSKRIDEELRQKVTPNLGDYAFLLVGLGGVILNLARHLRKVLHSNLSLELLDAFVYESSRPNRFMNAVYERQVLSILPYDRYAFRFEMHRFTRRVSVSLVYTPSNSPDLFDGAEASNAPRRSARSQAGSRPVTPSFPALEREETLSASGSTLHGSESSEVNEAVATQGSTFLDQPQEDSKMCNSLSSALSDTSLAPLQKSGKLTPSSATFTTPSALSVSRDSFGVQKLFPLQDLAGINPLQNSVISGHSELMVTHAPPERSAWPSDLPCPEFLPLTFQETTPIGYASAFIDSYTPVLTARQLRFIVCTYLRRPLQRVESFVCLGSPGSMDDSDFSQSSPQPVLLTRGLEKSIRRVESQKRNNFCLVENNLEMRIVLSSLRLSFTAGSGDIFCRGGSVLRSIPESLRTRRRSCCAHRMMNGLLADDPNWLENIRLRGKASSASTAFSIGSICPVLLQQLSSLSLPTKKARLGIIPPETSDFITESSAECESMSSTTVIVGSTREVSKLDSSSVLLGKDSHITSSCTVADDDTHSVERKSSGSAYSDDDAGSEAVHGVTSFEQPYLGSVSATLLQCQDDQNGDSVNSVSLQQIPEDDQSFSPSFSGDHLSIGDDM